MIGVYPDEEEPSIRNALFSEVFRDGLNLGEHARVTGAAGEDVDKHRVLFASGESAIAKALYNSD